VSNRRDGPTTVDVLHALKTNNKHKLYDQKHCAIYVTSSKKHICD